MSFIGVTGDTHGDPRSINKLNSKNFARGRELSKDDVVIIAGDFGFLWEQKESAHERYWLDWLNDKPFTVAFIDGNHENFDRLNALDCEDRFSGSVGVVRDSVLHLKRGYVYDICDKSIFVMGGGLSVDKGNRLKLESGYKCKAGTDTYIKTGSSPKPRSLWWPEEYPNAEEWDFAWKNLARVKFSVDYVISHVPPARFIGLYYESYALDTVSLLLQDIYDVVSCSNWYHGHMHLDIASHHKVISVYNNILEIGETHES